MAGLVVRAGRWLARVARWLNYALLAALVALWLALAGQWVRCRWNGDLYVLVTPHVALGATFSRSGLIATSLPLDPPEGWQFEHQDGGADAVENMDLWFLRDNKGWFRWVVEVGGRGKGEYWAFVPFWLLLAVPPVYPGLYMGLALVQRRRRARRGRNQCATCGYDLRAHTPGQRCPECGEAIGAARTKA